MAAVWLGRKYVAFEKRAIIMPRRVSITLFG